MSKNLIALLAVLSFSSLATADEVVVTQAAPVVSAPAPAVSTSTESTTASTIAEIKIETPVVHKSSSYDLLVNFQAGEIKPTSMQISNGSYDFNYGSNTSWLGQVGVAVKLFDLLGGFYFQEGVGYSSFSGAATTGVYNLNLFSFDSRIMYSADWFPWKPLVPFAEAGYLYSNYFQPGTTGLDSVAGSVGNPVFGLGARLWLNRGASMTGATPIFISGKMNRILAANSTSGFNLASTSIFGGLTLGF